MASSVSSGRSYQDNTRFSEAALEGQEKDLEIEDFFRHRLCANQCSHDSLGSCPRG